MRIRLHIENSLLKSLCEYLDFNGEFEVIKKIKQENKNQMVLSQKF